MTFALVDLRDYPKPFFDQPRSPLREPSKNEAAQRWARTMGELDGFVFVTGEYNHSIPAVLENALDHVYAELNRKPATFVGYGNAGGARAIEQLRLMLVELQVAPLRGAVHLSREQFIGILLDGKTFADFAPLAQAGEAMRKELIWWAEALRASCMKRASPAFAARSWSRGGAVLEEIRKKSGGMSGSARSPG